ncbi:MAG: CDC48 family AAA ATPase [Sulfolobales archaeon]|nr:CDC48 family AAA ATPase [Sulfolobales archaeon]MCX8198960.1 CDC48 family AAA ATPase [Sulfolobales archaeon]MDW8169939.1 CDC48 family AAA ATPase [Desulfurococcaceae archaeon]
MSDKGKEVKLTVEQAYPGDTGRKIARVSRNLMNRLGLSTGDFIEVEGPKGKILAQAWPLRPDDEFREIIRLDSNLRRAIGSGVGEAVTVRPVRVEPATKVVLAPIEARLVGTDLRDLEEYVKQTLMRKPISKGEVVSVEIYNWRVQFLITSTQPTSNVYITESTELVIRGEPVSMEAVERQKGIPKVTWEDIGDLEEAKQKVREMVEWPLKRPELFERLGIEPPKGILLYGPPGTGKTLLAKALANEIGAYFIAINGPEIMSKYYGESEARLREIFDEAEKNAPAIVFIDEIDSIAPKREEVVGEVEKRVVSQLLTLMDGLKGRGKIIVIGATNRPDALDPALRRPGRFDREIEIRPPDKNARREILLVHTRNVPLADDVAIDKLADVTHGYTGADLAALVREAAMIALRKFISEEKIDLSKPIPPSVLQKLKVTMKNFVEAMKGVGPSLIREVFVEIPEVHWSDIGGLSDVKQQLREAVEWPLKYPRVFEEMGIEPPKGILLYGPPGTGKTLLAKAVATESGANFIAVRGPEVLSKWVGESEKAIREIFRRARQVAPAVIFFDEIDSIVPVRGGRFDSGVTDRIVNQLLTEMDGIGKLKNVVVIAATNRPDILDPALLRPGRFDRLIYVPPPDFAARIEIFKIHTRSMPLSKDVDLNELAKKTDGYTGADIAAVCREAAMIALREEFVDKGHLDMKTVEMRHFIKAIDIVSPSLSKDLVEMYEALSKYLKTGILKERRMPGTTYIG